MMCRSKFLSFCGALWSARNKANVGEKMSSVNEICNSVAFYAMKFLELANQDKPVGTTPCHRWKPPPPNFYKINIDESFQPETKRGGSGFVARRTNGSFVEGGMGNIFRAASALHAESLGAFWSLKRVAELGMSNIILETDASVLGQALTSDVMDRSPYGGLFRQIGNLIVSQFEECIVSVCPRSCNAVADSLAAHGACSAEPGWLVHVGS